MVTYGIKKDQGSPIRGWLNIRKLEAHHLAQNSTAPPELPFDVRRGFAEGPVHGFTSVLDRLRLLHFGLVWFPNLSPSFPLHVLARTLVLGPVDHVEIARAAYNGSRTYSPVALDVEN